MKIFPLPRTIQRRVIAPVRSKIDRAQNWLFPNPGALLGYQPAMAGGPNMPNSFAMSSIAPGANGSAGKTPRENLVKLLKKRKYKDIDLVEKAFVHFAGLSEEQQKHNLTIANRLIELSVSAPTIAASLVTGCDLSKIKEPAVRRIAENRAKLDVFDCDYSNKEQLNYLRSLLFLAAVDREVLVTLSVEDRIELEKYTGAGKHEILNLFETASGPPSVAIERAKRGFFVTSWILKYLEYRDEAGTLEDLALLHLNPKKFKEIEEHPQKELGMNRAEMMEQLTRIANDINLLCNSEDMAHLPCEIKFRVKRISSIVKKEAVKGEAHDVNGIRLVLESNKAEDCYAALFRIREYFGSGGGWNEVNKLYDDYIANPKPGNKYRSIHVVFQKANFEVEFQIRTREMDFDAEFGQASHAGYKTKEKIRAAVMDLPIAEQRFKEKQNVMNNAGVYFVYDKAGRLYSLITDSPKQAPSLLDFAFAIGIDTGLHTVGGSINGIKAKALQTTLQQGQTIEVWTNPTKLLFRGRSKKVFSSIARAVITAANGGDVDLHAHLDRDQLVRRGKMIFQGITMATEAEFAHLKTHFRTEPRLKYSMERLLNRRGLSEENDFYINLALLPNSFDPLLGWIRQFIYENSLLVASSRKGHVTDVQVLTETRQRGVFRRVIQLLEKHGLNLRQLEQSQLRGTRFSLLNFSITGPADNVDQFKNDVENLYLGLLPSPGGRGSVLDLSIKVAKDGTALRPLLDIFYQQNANIISCAVPPSITGQDLFYEFRLQFPEGTSKKRAKLALREGLNGLKKIGTPII